MRTGLILIGLSWAAALSAQVPDPAFFKGDPQKVMLFCADRARQLDPHKQAILAEAGRAHLVAGDLTGARALFDIALSGRADALLGVGKAWIEAGDLPRGQDAFERILLQDRFANKQAAEAAAFLMDHGHAQAAEPLMQKAFELAPGDWQTIHLYARACLRQKRSDLAAEWFAKAAAKNRKEEAFWMDAADALANHGIEDRGTEQ